eukprot:CAMPEP_0119075362 /NCGR_PEP_ID=MMETSP1178-20130426/79598_1 /TAXON_ID=33656 /ORGANISM="unid sp, Strain CCMP2000" /LENGTH=171 /DNA_ID=CAMNT_0007057579 /DNA_START=9 /DNA_END=524 /DNA_ORIENTATION=+
MLSRRLGRGALRAPALVRHMVGTPDFPPPMGTAEDPLVPTLVIEESVSGLAAGLPMKPDREIWADPDALLPERHELWWDDGTAEPEWYVDRDHPRPITPAAAAAELGGVLSFVLFGVGGFAYYMGDDMHKRAAPRAEFGWPTDRDDFKRKEMGRKEPGTTGFEDEDEDDDE